MTKQVPISDGLFTWPADEPCLIGSECAECGAVIFPAQEGCPRCTSADTHPRELSRRGTLWTWTVQGFPPKSPPFAGDTENFQPFGVGYVELPDEVKVETRLTVADPELLEIGAEMQLVFEPLYTNDDGDEVITFAFAPVGDPATNGSTS